MKKIAIIGLGYVGLPLAVEFGRKYHVVGFDINAARVAELNAGHDHTLETEDADLQSVLFQKGPGSLKLTTKVNDILESQIYIVTVPTPIDDFKRPDLRPLIKASETIGKVISKGDIVIYESTVYPGATEEDCIPVIEKVSGLKFNVDFFAGYSPERINPGDKINTLTSIKKITSGSTPEIADEVDALYNSILKNGTHKAPTMKVAEAAKVIENAQRDLNISFVNELALIFDRMGIDTNDVIDAAGTKWNFIKYRPGLVGGHCISVDPYYLAFKAEALGYYPDVIRSGRRVNDDMAHFVVDKVVKLMIRKGLKILGSKVLLLGVTFKENCPDIRNTKTVDIVGELQAFGCQVDIFDPWASQEEVHHEFGIKTMEKNADIYAKKYDGIILAVSHEQFAQIDYKRLMNGTDTVIFDIKGFLPRDIVDGRL
jgi:UDP-N-acetyl-D-galactosamine dehydrogenase